ncbi:Mur ligase family protein [Priestia megaterium]|uniref:UDP-N-acetylmuramoyl-tripeptide--D-alanyl-D-alanine ligase n=1 Tax=Priestia megaterium TaxID=1404 RepID=A0A6M6DWJ3_PRIMG|nr:UDP-N-acetylmuramoyl-tripeptide--D-alanyl-D-alanine ligase [Priestia megaterium]QJX79060.1 UDP-N-acetylmuramoyl-tripeptide--D-alanyl-D-alanine ligase [Priestia megaterium]
MRHFTLNEILKQTGGDLCYGSGNPVIKHAINYAKKDIEDHTLIFHLDREPIRGKYWKENHSIVVITDHPELCTNLEGNIILVKTAQLEEAYWKFIEYYRGLFDLPVIGVTGTCGKTTTKEMIRQILIEDYKVKATWMSMNSMSVNLRYLTGIDDTTEVAVFEMPVAYPGYLKVACRYFQPQIRILLNIGVHHLADCETPEEYMKAKAEIVEGLDPNSGILILNADDENIKRVLDVRHLQNVVYIGKNGSSQFQAKDIKYANGGMAFTLKYQNTEYDAFIPGYGEHNVYNALAAIAAVFYVGVDISVAIQRLSLFEQVEEHLEFKRGMNECTVINDTWNSSPLSMATALGVLSDMSKEKQSIALLGYMPQLGEGPYAIKQYEDMGKKAAESKIDILVVVGEEAKAIGTGALKCGMDPNKVYFCKTGDEVYNVLAPYLNENTMILLKVTHRVMTKPTFKELRNKLIPDNEE